MVVLRLTVDRLERAGDVAAEWRALEQRASPSFFQSWTWIGTWVAQAQAALGVLRLHDGGSLVAMGIVSFRSLRRRAVVPVNVLSLHETGDSRSDRLTIEYNGFLIDRSRPADLPTRILKSLAGWSSRACFAHDWDEVSLSGVSEAWVDALRASGLRTVVDRSEPVLGIPLVGSSCREDLLAGMGPHTRGQVRRSLRELGKHGPVEVSHARTIEEAKEFLARLGSLNIRRWAGHAPGSPYSGDGFCKFHAALVACALPRGEVELLELRAGDTPIGYAYNFLWGRTAHHYSSGFAAASNPRLKPGLVCHVLSAERYARRGMQLYDLMAGDARYKRSLGRQQGMLYWVRGQRNRAKLRVEAGLVAMRRRIAQLRSSRLPSNSDE